MKDGLILGWEVADGEVTNRLSGISTRARCEHIVILGKTGSGKTSLIKSMLEQDIRSRNGFLCIDLHGDLSPFIFDRIAQEERRTREDLSTRTVLIDPADPLRAAAFNVLSSKSPFGTVAVSEVVALLKQRWSLDYFGARTEELLRNCLYLLVEQGRVLTDLIPLLVRLSFRAELVQKSVEKQVKAYFRERFDQWSEAMQAVAREPILNKVTAFTSDPAIRHLVGQSKSSFEPIEALDRGYWIILRLPKGQLGDNAETLAALVLTKFKNAIFGRRSKNLFTIYADELQSLVSSASTFETLLSEARKFSVSIVTANQHLQQHSPAVRAALLSAGTQLFFRSSPEDAPHLAATLNGGKAVEQHLKELPNRQFLARVGEYSSLEIYAQAITPMKHDTKPLLQRINQRWTRPREEIENEISGAVATGETPGVELSGWK